MNINNNISKPVLVICVFLSLVLPTLSLFSYSYSYVQPHSCYKPYKPYSFTDQYEVDRYNNEVQIYKDCINEFVDEKQNEIRDLKDAMNNAIEEWNSFVRYGT
jgi:hypothetical protein